MRHYEADERQTRVYNYDHYYLYLEGTKFYVYKRSNDEAKNLQGRSSTFGSASKISPPLTVITSYKDKPGIYAKVFFLSSRGQLRKRVSPSLRFSVLFLNFFILSVRLSVAHLILLISGGRRAYFDSYFGCRTSECTRHLAPHTLDIGLL